MDPRPCILQASVVPLGYLLSSGILRLGLTMPLSLVLNLLLVSPGFELVICIIPSAWIIGMYYGAALDSYSILNHKVNTIT